MPEYQRARVRHTTLSVSSATAAATITGGRETVSGMRRSYTVILKSEMGLGAVDTVSLSFSPSPSKYLYAMRAYCDVILVSDR